MPTIKRLEVVDWRYPTSLKLDGSDAVHKKPDYSCVYMVMHTDDPKLVGHGLTFTCGRGNEIVKRMIEAFEFLVVGKDLEKDFIADPVEFMRTLTQDGQLRWLGPEKGVIGLAVNCITNALWDMWARKENKPFWMLVATMEPEQLIKCIDFHHMTDCITPEEGLALLKKQRPGWEKRVEEIKQNGYPTYTTGAGWLGYSEEKTRGLCRDLMNEGFTHFKMKVGSEKVEDDMERAEWIRNEIGEKNVLMMDANQKWDV
jgi:L-fuconate dehydratase